MNTEKQTTKNYLQNLEEAYLKKDIEALAVPWNKFCYVGRWSEIYYDTTALTRLLVDLLHTVKLEKIEIQCGIGLMNFLDIYAKYNPIEKNIRIGDCIISVKQNLDIGKFDLVYDGILLMSESIVEKAKEECKANKIVKKECELSKAVKDLNETLDSCIDCFKPEEKNKKSFWEKLKNWLGLI